MKRLSATDKKEALQNALVSFGEYRYQDEYVVFNGYGNLETFNNPADHVDIAAIAADILENEENYNYIELEEVEEETED